MILAKLNLIGTKLGRFTPERKAILEAIRAELRKRNYLPVVFDFEGTESRDLTETVSLLAHMARFVIADITDGRSIPQELASIVPSLPSVPVQPILLAGADEYGMFEHFKNFPWVLEIHRYDDERHLLASLKKKLLNRLRAAENVKLFMSLLEAQKTCLVDVALPGEPTAKRGKRGMVCMCPYRKRNVI